MILVGNEIGANNVPMAKRYSKLILIWAVVLAFGGVLGRCKVPLVYMTLFF